MNQPQHHRSHLFTFPQRSSHESQLLVHQPRLQQLTHQHQHQQHQHFQSHNHPHAASHGHTTQVLQHSRHQQQHQPELPVLISVGSGHGQLRKGRWSPSEDERLRSSIRRHGANKWKLVAKDVMSRSGDQCWKRWNDSLDPHLNHSQWLPSEDSILEAAVLRSGRLWSKIASDSLPGRSGLSCKNRWDHIQRKQRRIHQSQREVLQGHASSRSFLESTIFSEQRTVQPRSSGNLDSANTSNHSRIPSLGDGFNRHSAAMSSFESHHSSFDNDDENNRTLMASTGGAHFYRSSSHRSSYPRPYVPLLSSSWGGLGGQSISNSGLSPYISHTSSFSSPKDDSSILPTTHGYSSSSPYPGSTLGNYVLHSSSNPAPPPPSRSHGSSWMAMSSANQPGSLLSILEPGACTGGMLTYGEEVESSAYSHQHGGSSDNVDSSHSTSFVTASGSTSASAPELPCPWPARSSSLLTNTPRYNYASSQAAVWTPKSSAAEVDTRSYTAVPSTFYSRLGSLHHERMSDDQEPPRTQQSCSATSTTAEATSSNDWKTTSDWQQAPRDVFSNRNASHLAKPLPSNPFAYSTDALAREEDVYSATDVHQHQKSRGLETSRSDGRESGAGVTTGTSSQAVESLQQQQQQQQNLSSFTPKVPKLEDISHSMFYDDVQYSSQPRRLQQDESYHDDEVTSDEEESQHSDHANAACSAPQHSDSSEGSPFRPSSLLL